MTKREKKIGIVMGIVITVWLFTTLSKDDAKGPVLPQPLSNEGAKATTLNAVNNALPPLDLTQLKKHIEKGVITGTTNGELRDPFVPIKKIEAEQKEVFDIGRLQLMGVIIDNGVANAVINDQMLREGDEIEGCVVERITRLSVTVVHGHERFTLKLYPDVKKKDGAS